MRESVGSWVYLFSLFTREALLFEALAIFALLILYSTFWIVQKRRLGSAKNVIPAGLVKTYLNALIQEAEVLRAQLFGLLATSAAASGAPSPTANGPTPTSAEALALLQAAATSAGAGAPSIRQLETKMSEQAQAMNALVAEKAKLEKELSEAKSSAAKTPSKDAAAAPSGANPDELKKLQDKINLLESRLAEYSVIEDDLANLKRLQQENAQLKASIASTGGAAAAEPSVTTPTQAPTPELVASPTAVEKIPETPAPVEPQTTASPEFEKVVDQVEQNLKLPEATAEPAPAAAAPAASPAPTETPPPAAAEKTDADLIAEFEKMLNS